MISLAKTTVPVKSYLIKSKLLGVDIDILIAV